MDFRYERKNYWYEAYTAELLLKRIISEDESEIGAISDRDCKRRVKILIENYFKEINV